LPRLILSEEAEADLDVIWAYISGERSPAIADAVIARLYGAMDALVRMPRMGRLRSDLPGQPRSFAVRPHMIFYEPISNEGGIGVWRVLHGARDIGTLIVRPTKDLP
jgi:toxin ParE1/3/4